MHQTKKMLIEKRISLKQTKTHSTYYTFHTAKKHLYTEPDKGLLSKLYNDPEKINQ